MLTVLVNFSHSLSTETASIFEIANTEIVYRLDTNFNPDSRELYIKHEDFPKILNTFTDHMNMMSHDLREQILTFLVENDSQFNYNILSEIAVIYATKMDPIYRDSFFQIFKVKFLKELSYLDSETLYKIIWSLAKSKAIIISD